MLTPTHADDLQLARDSLAGDGGARQQFATRLRCVPKMLTVICSRLSYPLAKEDLEDLVQDTLVSIWRRLDSYRGMASLETWAYRFCRFEMANRLRSRGRRPRHVTVEGYDAPSDPTTDLLEFEHVHQALDRIEERDAQIIRLKHFEDRSFDDIGHRLSISPNTAKSRYYRGLERLRQMLLSEHREEIRADQGEVES